MICCHYSCVAVTSKSQCRLKIAEWKCFPQVRDCRQMNPSSSQFGETSVNEDENVDLATELFLAHRQNVVRSIQERCFSSQVKDFALHIQDENVDLATELYYSHRQNVVRPGQERCYSNRVKAFSLFFHNLDCSVYNFFADTFTLPDPKFLESVRESIPLKTGVSNVLLKRMQNEGRFMRNIDKICVLIFGKIKLKKWLDYDPVGDCILGYEDVNGKRFPNFAEEAVVLIARGLVAKWNQPVALYLAQSMSESDLKEAVRDAVVALQDVGVKVAAIVSDSAHSNVSVLESLATETWGEDGIIQIGMDKIFVFIDSHHLLKDLRDIFYMYDIQFKDQEEIKIAKFEILKKFLEHQENNDNELYRLFFPADIILKDHGLDAEANEEKNFKLSKTLFSRDLIDSLLDFFRETQNTDVLHLRKYLSVVNLCFESFIEGKFVNAVIKANSHHHALWNAALETMEEWKFVARSPDVALPQTKCVHLMRQNLVNALALWDEMRTFGVKRFKINNLNLNLLRSSFGSDNQRGHNVTNPPCKSFLIQFKTLWVNSFLTCNHLCAVETIDSFSDMLNNTYEENSDSQEVSKKQMGQTLTSFASQFLKKEVEDSTKWIQGLTCNTETEKPFRIVPNLLLSYLQKRDHSNFISSCSSCYKSVYHCKHSKLPSGTISCCKRTALNSSLVKEVYQIYVCVLQKLQNSGHELHLTEKLRECARSNSFQSFSCSDHRAEFQRSIVNFIVQAAIERFCFSVNWYLHEQFGKKEETEQV